MLGRWIEYLVIRWIVSVIGMLPIEWCETFARGLAWVFADLVKFRRKVIVENLTSVYPEMTPTEVSSDHTKNVVSFDHDGHRGRSCTAADSRHQLSGLRNLARPGTDDQVPG